MTREYFSVSSLGLYEKCPRCWFLKYEAGIEQTTIPEPAHFGKAVHAGLAAFYEDKESPKDYFFKALKEDFDKVITGAGVQSDLVSLSREGNTIMQVYPHKCWYFGKPIAVEGEYLVNIAHPLTHEYLPLPINAHLDLETSEGLVVDHKIVGSPIQGIVGRYKRQMVAYWMVYESVRGVSPEGFIFNQVLRRKGIPKILPPLRDIATTEDKVHFWEESAAMLAAIDRGEFDRNNSIDPAWHEYPLICS